MRAYMSLCCTAYICGCQLKHWQIYTASPFQHLIRRLLLIQHIRLKTEISNPRPANRVRSLFSHLQHYSLVHLYRVSSEKSHHQKNKSQSPGNPTTFKQINKYVLVHPWTPTEMFYLSCTLTHTHRHTCESFSSWAEEYSRHCNSHPVWAKPEISSKGETPGSSIAPNYWGLEAESTATVLYNHIVWEEISPLSILLWAVRCRPGLLQKPLKLSYSEREQKWLELLVEKDSMQFCS